jgi:hypothetical protein
MATCVTIVRAALETGSAKLTASVPTAATAPSVVCANLWIENDPITGGAKAASPPDVVGVGAVGDPIGVVGDSAGVVGGASAVVGGSIEIGGGSVGIVGSVGVSNVPVIGMISLPDVI